MKHFNPSLLIIKLIVGCIFMVASQNLMAQAVYTLAQNTAVEIKVLGKTNADHIVIATTSMEGQGNFKFDGQNLDDVTSLSFNLYAENIQASKSAVNKRAFKVLNATKNPNIRFKVKCATVTPTQNNKYGVILGGELTVGGVTQLKCMLLNATMNDDSTITLTGHTNVQLTNDNLKSIKFMEGPVKVDNDLAIQFTFIYKKDLIQDAPIQTPHNMMQDYITKL
jgi:polyisoprenoid-binding protein YceI